MSEVIYPQTDDTEISKQRQHAGGRLHPGLTWRQRRLRR